MRPSRWQPCWSRAATGIARLHQLDAQARAAWRAARVELEALLRDLRPYLNGNSYRGKDSDETFDAWLQALADWSEGGEQPANLGKFGQTRIKLTAKRVAPEHAALRAIDAWAAHQEERPDLAPHLLLHALGEVGRELEVEKQRRAEIGFDDLLSRLDRALQGPGGERLAQLIREQFPVALIDEFRIPTRCSTGSSSASTGSPPIPTSPRRGKPACS